MRSAHTMSRMAKRHPHAPRERLSLTEWETAIPSEVRATLAWRRIPQKELVDALGLEQSYLSRRINGKARMTPGELLAICDFLNEDIGALLSRAKHNAKHPPHGEPAMRVA
jgi:DNA-binding Xre family transcriptional regulator